MSRWTWWRETERPRTKCPVDEPMLQSYLDGELDAPAAGRVRAHVAECHRCARELSVYQRITRALGAREGTDEAALGRLRDLAESLAERESREPGPGSGQPPAPAPGAEQDPDRNADQSAVHKTGG
ncbi:zf-HC2 domain-containing protein [Streptomyces sp. NPDC005336]|uniref:anti-sigma factor family protein n=1 Tax=unclassified Streptomyces TaxID=2593676 RepID=UPI0033B875C3